MELDIDVILADLKEGKVPRTQQNLDKLNDTLKAYAESGQRDFSITQIGRVSAENGGLAYEALRATRNKHYRTLIEAWAAKYKTSTKKPLSNTSRSKSIPADNKLLERIPDLRYVPCLVKSLPSVTVTAKRSICSSNTPILPSTNALCASLTPPQNQAWKCCHPYQAYSPNQRKKP